MAHHIEGYPPTTYLITAARISNEKMEDVLAALRDAQQAVRDGDIDAVLSFATQADDASEELVSMFEPMLSAHRAMSTSPKSNC